MSDKSYGDPANRNLVKNPLLSTAVTGLSIEDLTHNAVLLPAASQELNIVQGQLNIGTQARSLGHTNKAPPNLPSGDANTNIIFSKPPNPTPNLIPTQQQTIKNEKFYENISLSQSKALPKSEDDFDVNEYFARLQGTRYVSAPLNVVKDDANANLQAEETLEEINLNETDKPSDDVAQSLTADIAQNFSQLPTVLPQVASAVFSSFSNMLSMKSKENTPDGVRTYHEVPKPVNVGVPLAMSEEPKEVAPPLMKPPTVGTGNYRITTKKKAYAQIPGLNSSEAQPVPSHNPPIQTNIPPYFVPDNIPIQNPIDIAPTSTADAVNANKVDDTSINTFDVFNPESSEVLNVAQPQTDQDTSKIQRFSNQGTIEFTYKTNVGQSHGHNLDPELNPPTNASITQPQIPLLPPPPMFSNLPRTDSQPFAGKSVLPPSVARRISANQPIIKTNVPQATNIASNIFVPLALDNTPTEAKANLILPTSLTASSVSQSSVNVPLFGVPNVSSLSNETTQMASTNLAVTIDSVAPTLSSFSGYPPTSNVFPPAELPPQSVLPPATPINPAAEALPISIPISVPYTPAQFVPTTTQKEKSSTVAFFNPTSYQQDNAPIDVITQSPPISNPPVDIISEPPKVTGNLNYRMTKKRPQYYSGPIEGVGAISNNVKPTINPVEIEAYQGALFTPDQQQFNVIEQAAAPSIDNATVPFDISQPVQNVQPYNMPEYQPVQHFGNSTYNTTFDVSRPADNNESTKEESKGFGIIGSLKSKLSSIDINKIQNSVTMLFDPAYNDGKSSSDLSNTYGAPQSYEQNYRPLQSYSENQFANFEIFVPTNMTPYDSYGGCQNPVYPVHDNIYKAQHQYDVYQDPMTGQAYPAFSYYSAVSTESNQAYAIAAGNAIVTPSTSVHEQISTQIYGPYNADAGNVFSAVQVEVNSQDNQHVTKPCVIETTEDHQEEGSKNKVSEKANVKVLSNKAMPEEIQPKEQNKSEKVVDHFASISGYDKDQTSSTQFDFNRTLMRNPSNDVKETITDNESIMIGQHKLENFGALKDKYLSKFKDDKPTLANPIPTPTQYDRNIIVKQIESNQNVDNEKTDDLLTASFSNENSGESLLKITELTLPVLKERQDSDNISEFNICETCREVNKPEGEEGENDDLTSQMIENITSRIQLMNPVEVPLPESAEVNDNQEFDLNQFAEISHVTEETIETLQKQAAAEFLDNLGDKKGSIYDWSDNNTKSAQDMSDHDYTFQLNPNNIGFYGTNSLLSDRLPKNEHEIVVSDFEKVISDYKVSQDVLSLTQPGVPSAAPIKDVKEEESGVLDVNSIEQDAKEDFVYEEFVIEPTGDDKTENVEMQIVKRSDTFTNRVEKFKMKEETDQDDDVFDMQMLRNQVFDLTASPAITIASYFDTGNYAVESHYRNSLTSPTLNAKIVGPPDYDGDTETDSRIQIPPGFEDIFKRKLSGAHQDLKSPVKNDSVPNIPETDTQTCVLPSVTFSSAYIDSSKVSSTYSSNLTLRNVTEFGDENVSFNQEMKVGNQQTQPIASEIIKLPDFASVFGAKNVVETEEVKLLNPDLIHSNPMEVQPIPANLPDPINFFSTETKPGDSKDKTEEPGFNRLASYFTSPPKTDHKKSFFELSQSQNHYRHVSNTNDESINDSTNIHSIPMDRYTKNLNLIKDLASHNNINPPKVQVIRTVHYFSVEYDSKFKSTIIEPGCAKLSGDGDLNVKLDELKTEITDNEFEEIINNCQHCCNIDCVTDKIDLNKSRFKLRKCMDGGNSEQKKDSNKMDRTGDEVHQVVTVNFNQFTLQNDGQEEMSLMNEGHRSSSEYVPVTPHWFYRVDFDGKSIWRGFSVVDSKNLEEAFNSPTLNENTLVQTDGGRFDVNIIGRLRIAVYWSEKPTNVRRCSWFYKGTTDARYVPYTEQVAEKLEEEYRRGMTTGEWHRRLVLPSNELVVMHGPLVMVHFLQSGPDLAFTGPTIFTFGKRVYRNTPKIHMYKDQHQKIDHLLLVTHGAGEYRSQMEKDQSTARPRIVHRGCVEPEIEDPEPSSIDHLLLMCHGVGSACDLKMRPIELVVDDFRATSSQLTQSHYRNSFENGVVGRVEVLPISWHAALHGGEKGVDARLQQVTLNSIPKLRAFTNDTVLDVLLYTSPVFCQTIINTVCSELNRIHSLFLARNPQFTGRVSLAGHSLGSLILYDVLCHQTVADHEDSDKKYVEGIAGTGQPSINYPRLEFSPEALYAMGSPIAIFECIRGVKSLGDKFALPTCRNFFNIFHPYDPIAYRIEPLINPQLKQVKPYLIPHHKGRKRMHLELKDTMARVGADIKQKVIESIKATWSSMWKTQLPPSDRVLDKVVEEEMEKGRLEEEKEEQEEQQPSPEMLGLLNSGRRIDYVLQEAPIEMINEYIFAMGSHVCYWESEDTMLLILREIYSSLGVQPDSSVPQSNMTVPRAGICAQPDPGVGLADPGSPSLDYKRDEVFFVNSTEMGPNSPSTSRGGT